MSKRKRKKRRSALPKRAKRPGRQSSQGLQEALDRADHLILSGRAPEAIELLEPFLESHSRKANLHYLLGYARAKSGDIWGALSGYERAQKLSKNPSYWSSLASLYLEVGQRAHALRAFHQAINHQDDFPLMGNVRGIVAALEQDLAEIAHSLDLPVGRAENGIYHMERGRQALTNNNYPATITASRQAIKLLGNWPPPHNNLTLALFWNGQPDEAITAARRVLSHAPDNVHALSNAIRYLAWTGCEDKARELWDRLKTISPVDDDARRKIGEAAAIMGKDEFIYQLLRPLVGTRPSRAQVDQSPHVTDIEHFYLAIAEANTGRRHDARRRLRALRRDWAWANVLLEPLKTKKAGPGYSKRFPYFNSTDLLPRGEIEKFIKLAERQDELPYKRFRREMEQFVARFPQVIRMAEKLILEEDQPDAGIEMLNDIGTPEAYDALRRFALSQLGDDDTRMQTLTRLMEAEEISEDDVLCIWIDGEWRDVQFKVQYFPEDDEAEYPPQVAELVNRGIDAQQKGDHALAERLFQQALELEPGVKQAYNNLGAIYAQRGEHDRAREVFHKALELDPLYPIPRCNLANYLLNDDDVEGAEAMLEPIVNAPPDHPKDVAFYSYIQGRLLFHKKEYDAARRALRASLKALPDYAPAKNLLEHLDKSTPLLTNFDNWVARQHKRDQAKRARMQAKLTTPDPTLSDALSIHTKDILIGMARAVLSRGGWSALRKAELHHEVVEALSDPYFVELAVNGLNDDDRTALRQMLANGGTMPWKDFDTRYGNDLEDSPYWNYHVPETTMGKLRLRGLLAEATVNRELLVTIPSELRPILEKILD
ncbi:MAG: tetratricopeptide repeat protein [Chloroflexi bacterium]|nr:tetratricopeptide repeat protein [Chloroflexota bacterium]